MYIDVPETAKAVVICVIIFNAAFGYRWVIHKLIHRTAELLPHEAGGLSLGCTLPRCVDSTQIKSLSKPRLQIMPLTVRAKGVSLSTAVRTSTFSPGSELIVPRCRLIGLSISLSER